MVEGSFGAGVGFGRKGRDFLTLPPSNTTSTSHHHQQTAAEVEAHEFGDWRWGRPAPHYHDAAGMGTGMGSSASSMGSSGSSFLSRAVSSAFGSSKGMMVPDGGDAEAEAAAAACLLGQGGQHLLPQAVAYYVNHRMRFDTFLQLREMLAA